MKKFDKDFFNEEIREGFLVSEIMKKSWATQMAILDVLIKIFEENNLIYYAEVGTMLGAVRHRGFVPWDDDIDIAMPRRDYMRFLQLSDKLPEDLCIRSFYNVESFSSYHAVVAHKSDKLRWDEDRRRKYYGCPFICFVDVFPLDYIPKDRERFRIQKELYYFSYKLAFDCKAIEETLFGNRLVTYKELCGIEKDPVTTFLKELGDLQKYVSAILKEDFLPDNGHSMRNQLYLLTDRVAQMCDEKDADAVDYSPNLAYSVTIDQNKPRKLEWYRDRKKLPFEDMEILVPVGCREELANQYGENYMIPLKFASAHDYPFFREEIQVLIGGDTGDRYSERAGNNYFTDLINTLQEALVSVQNYTLTPFFVVLPGEIDESVENYDLAMNILAQAQENAVEIGNTLEKMFAGNAKVISCVEGFCEHVYELYNLINDDAVKGEIYIKETECFDDLNLLKNAIYETTHQEALTGKKLSDDWKRITGKRVVLYALSATDIVNSGSRGPERIREFLSYVEKDRENTSAIVFYPGGVEEFIEKCELSGLDEYIRLIEDIKKMDFIVALEDPDTIDVVNAVLGCDWYYGDKCKVADVCESAGKTVVFQKYQF